MVGRETEMYLWLHKQSKEYTKLEILLSKKWWVCVRMSVARKAYHRSEKAL